MTSFRVYREYLSSPTASRKSRLHQLDLDQPHEVLPESRIIFDHLRDRWPYHFAGVRQKRAKLRIWWRLLDRRGALYDCIRASPRHPDVERHDMRILATDIDTEVLSKAANGEYPAASIDDIPENYRSLFRPNQPRNIAAKWHERWLKSLISFRHLNLMEPWPMRGLFDAIFCRNVASTSRADKMTLIDRFVERLKPGAALYRPFGSLLGTHRT